MARPPEVPPMVLDLDDPLLVAELGVEVLLALVPGLLSLVALGPQPCVDRNKMN